MCVNVYCIVFIYLYSASHSMSLSEALPATTLILCRSEHAEALQATASEGLAQGPCVSARVGFEPATVRTEDTELTTELPRTTTRMNVCACVCASVCECVISFLSVLYVSYSPKKLQNDHLCIVRSSLHLHVSICVSVSFAPYKFPLTSFFYT